MRHGGGDDARWSRRGMSLPPPRSPKKRRSASPSLVVRRRDLLDKAAGSMRHGGGGDARWSRRGMSLPPPRFPKKRPRDPPARARPPDQPTCGPGLEATGSVGQPVLQLKAQAEAGGRSPCYTHNVSSTRQIGSSEGFDLSAPLTLATLQGAPFGHAGLIPSMLGWSGPSDAKHEETSPRKRGEATSGKQATLVIVVI